MLAKVLSDQLSRLVFYFTLDWAPDTNIQFAAPDGPSASLAELRTGPSIFTAIQEQLGCRLDPRKGQVEVVVIERIENTPADEVYGRYIRPVW